MTARSRWRRLRDDLVSLAVPITAYAVATLTGLGVFTAMILLFDDNPLDEAGLAVMSSLWLATIGGIALGQLTAVLRLRTWVVFAVFAASAFAGMTMFTAAAIGEATFAIIVVFVVLFLGPFFFFSGHLSLSTNAGLPSLFAPTVWITGAILTVAEKRGGGAAWFAGDKFAVWDVITAPILGVGVLAMLVFLASREQHRLHRWRNDPAAPIPADGAPDPTVRRAGSGIGCGGVLALVALALALTTASALSAPYLWRSEEDTDVDTDTDTDTAPPTDTDAANAPPTGGLPGPETGIGPVRRAAQQAGVSLLSLILILALLLAALVVFGPPLRRMLLLQHLRRPFWPVSPTRRVAQHWRLAEIALGDAGIGREPGDDAAAIARRAQERLGFVDGEALVRCAEIADRVAYGVAIRPEDVMVARRAAEMTFQTVWDELGEWARFRAMYRPL